MGRTPPGGGGESVKMPNLSDFEDYLKADMVEKDDLIELLDSGVIIPAEETRFKRTQFQINVMLPGQNFKIWTMNKTTMRNLAKEWGDDTENWVGHYVRVDKVPTNVRGVMKDVLYGHPAPTPLMPPTQAKIESPAAKADKIMAAIVKAKPDMTLAKVSDLVSEELKKSGGIFGEDTAAILVARTLGVDLESSGDQIV